VFRKIAFVGVSVVHCTMAASATAELTPNAKSKNQDVNSTLLFVVVGLALWWLGQRRKNR
jgi:hypothetical protein